MLGDDVLYEDISACARCGEHECSRLNLVRYDRVLRQVKSLYSDDTDHVGTGTLDVRAHTVQEVRNINDMRFLRTVLNYGTAFRHGGSHHDIDGSSHRNRIQEKVTSSQMLCLRADASVPYGNLRTQRFESLQMQVDRS